MNPVDPFKSEFHCHSKFRPPDIEAVEFKARRVWPDWDDFPPYQDQNIERRTSNNTNKTNDNREYISPNERAKKRYNMEIKKTQDEIEEMTKRFRLYDFDINEPRNRVNADYQSFEFFKTNQNFVRSPRHSAEYAYPITNNSDANRNINYRSEINNDYYYKDTFNNSNYTKYQSQPKNISRNMQNMSSKYYDQSFTNYEKNGDDIDYEITSAATLEAGLLREQNEAMRKRIAYLKQKLEAQKKENKIVLKKIEESEIDRHQMIDYLNSSKTKK